jgi:hypothetical protein
MDQDPDPYPMNHVDQEIILRFCIKVIHQSAFELNIYVIIYTIQFPSSRINHRPGVFDEFPECWSLRLKNSSSRINHRPGIPEEFSKCGGFKRLIHQPLLLGLPFSEVFAEGLWIFCGSFFRGFFFVDFFFVDFFSPRKSRKLGNLFSPHVSGESYLTFHTA